MRLAEDRTVILDLFNEKLSNTGTTSDSQEELPQCI